MSSMLDIEPASVASVAWLPALDVEQTIVAGPTLLPASLLSFGSKTSIEIAFPEFGGIFGGPVVVPDSEVDSGLVTATARIGPDVYLIMKQVGESAYQEGSTTETTIEIQHRNMERRRARDVFITYSLFALLALSRRVNLHLRVPGVEPLVPLSFNEPPEAASQYMQSRQLAYKVMLIEKATGEQFSLPVTRSAVEAATISFVYEAILKRSFLWPDNYDGGLIRLPSSAEALNELLVLTQGGDLKFGPQPISRTLFGSTIFLGVGTITVLDAIVEDSDEVRAAIESRDVRDVQVRVRSLSGRIRYDLPDAPRISEANWDRNTQALVDIGPQLDAALFERYNALAASTLAGLTEEEKAQVAVRVDFGAAFLPSEMNGENTLWRRLLRFLRFR